MNIRSTRSGQKSAVLFGVSSGRAWWWRQIPHWTAACWEYVRVTGAFGVASRTGDLTAAVCDGERVAGLFVSTRLKLCGTALAEARRRKDTTYPELDGQGGPCSSGGGRRNRMLMVQRDIVIPDHASVR